MAKRAARPRSLHPWELDVEAGHGARAARRKCRARPRRAHRELGGRQSSRPACGCRVYANSHGFSAAYPTSSHSTELQRRRERTAIRSSATIGTRSRAEPTISDTPESVGEESAPPRAAPSRRASSFDARTVPVICSGGARPRAFRPFRRGDSRHGAISARVVSARRARASRCSPSASTSSRILSFRARSAVHRSTPKASHDTSAAFVTRGVLEGYVLSSYSGAAPGSADDRQCGRYPQLGGRDRRRVRSRRSSVRCNKGLSSASCSGRASTW